MPQGSLRQQPLHRNAPSRRPLQRHGARCAGTACDQAVHMEVVSLQAELVVSWRPAIFVVTAPLPFGWKAPYPTAPIAGVPGRLPPRFRSRYPAWRPYRVTVADARQDGAGVWKTCEQALEIRTAEALAAVDAQKCELLCSRLEALGLEAHEKKNAQNR